MRVLWLSHFIPFPPKSGALQRGYNLLRAVARTHEVHVVSLNQRTILPSPAQIAEAENALNQTVASFRWFPIPSDGALVKRAAVAARSGLGRRPYDVVWLASSALRRHLRRLALGGPSFDLIHIDTIGLWYYTRCVPGTPTVLNHHNVESDLMARRAHRERRLVKRLFFRIEARKLRTLEREAGEATRMNLVVSELDAIRLRSIAPRASVVLVENGVDVDYFRPAPTVAPEQRSLVFVATLDWYPNREAAQFLVQDLLPELKRLGWSGRLTIVGRGGPSTLMESRDSQLKVTGFVDDARPYIDAAEVYVCPIRDGGGTRLKILDALAMEKPIVATGFAVEGLALFEEEHYLRAETPLEFASQIVRLQRDPALRRRLGQNGRRLVVARYSWATIGERLIQAYETAATDTNSQVGPFIVRSTL